MISFRRIATRTTGGIGAAALLFLVCGPTCSPRSQAARPSGAQPSFAAVPDHAASSGLRGELLASGAVLATTGLGARAPDAWTILLRDDPALLDRLTNGVAGAFTVPLVAVGGGVLAGDLP